MAGVDFLPVTYVYAFDHKHRKPPMTYKDLLGGKGANLAEMTTVLNLPVPPGFTVSTDACRDYMHGGWPSSLDAEVTRHVAKLEKMMGRKLGDANDPLLVSVRSGAKFSMPGMMDTVLNLGLNDASVIGLANVTGDERFAYDSYRRFIAMYARIVLDVDGDLFEHPLEAAKAKAGTDNDADLDAKALQQLVKTFLAAVRKATGSPFPQDLGHSLTVQSKQSSNRGMVRGRSPIEFVKRSATNSVLLSTFRRWCSVIVMTIQVPELASLVTLRPERTDLMATSW